MMRRMITNAWAWADQAPGRKRRNEVHGEEEIRFVLHDTFEFLDEQGDEMSQNGAFDMEALYLIPNTCTVVVINCSPSLTVF